MAAEWKILINGKIRHKTINISMKHKLTAKSIKIPHQTLKDNKQLEDVRAQWYDRCDNMPI